MKFYLTLLRREGKRLASDQVSKPPRLVTTRLAVEHGVRGITATCCYGGGNVAQLWEPTLVRLGEQDMTLRGIESQGDAGVVQEWQLRPHVVGPWKSPSECAGG